MKNYIYINSNLIIKLLKLIIDKSKQKKNIKKCPFCDKIFEFNYIYKIIKIHDLDIHLFKIHNIINSILYKQICNIEFKDFDIEWCLLETNQINIIDGLYEIGSNKMYIEKNKNISESKISRFSEHSGFIYLKKNKVSNINVITGSRVEQSDPKLYMPINYDEAFEVNYIFHTHPKTPYIGSRIKNEIIYEFPSISDIIHFIDHHNNGKLMGSIVIAPEGLYIIRKNNFNNKNISVDYDIMITDLENIFIECYNDSYLKYSFIDFNKYLTNNEINIPEHIFYEKIALDYEYINKINKVLIKYDVYIDYYARIFFDNNLTKKWIIDNIYIPLSK